MFFNLSRNKICLVVLAMSLVFAGCDKQADAPVEAETISVSLTPEISTAPRYSPDPHLNASQTMVGMIIPNTDGLLTRLAEHGFLRTAENLGYPATLYEADSSEAAAALVDQAIEDGVKGLLIWADSPAMHEAIKKAESAGIQVVVPYFPNDEEGVAANLVPDPTDFAPEAARIVCAQMEKDGKTSGIVVICGAKLEPEIADAFEAKIKADYPAYTVTRFEEELTEENIANFVRKNRDLAAVLSLDNNSGKLWNKACESVQAELRAAIKSSSDENTPKPDAPTPKPDTSYRRSAVILVLDYTEAHLAWVRDGLVYGVIARPYYDSTAKSMAVLDRLLRGLTTQTEVRLDAPVIRKNSVDKYVAIALEVKQWFGE